MPKGEKVLDQSKRIAPHPIFGKHFKLFYTKGENFFTGDF
jgi:hypothetical protein